MKCEICDYEYSSIISLRHHLNQIHKNTEKKSHSCTICSASFSLKSKLAMHFSRVHEGERPFKCSIRDQKFSQKGYVQQHIRYVHEGEKPYTCTICNIKFVCKKSLMYHIETNHKTNVNFQICGYELSNQANLDAHMKDFHEERKDYQCPHCNKVLKSKVT